MMNAKILIVDDDRAIRESLAEFLAVSKYQTHMVPSAELALEYLEENAVDVVITDILMGGMDGLALTDRVKSDHNADVIVMTGYSADYSYEEAISKGASDIVFKPVRFEELLLRLKRVLRERQLTNDRNQMLEKLKKLAITDGLTHLYNSRYFYNQLEIEIERFNRYGRPLSLLLLDIDHFKQFNDNFGHLEGDKVLGRIGSIIKYCLRSMDTGYRYGGEEFTVLLPETSGSEAMVVAERICKTIESECKAPVSGHNISITSSIGVTSYIPGEEVSAFVQRADQAMYNSKKAGRNQISLLTGKDV